MKNSFQFVLPIIALITTFMATNAHARVDFGAPGNKSDLVTINEYTMQYIVGEHNHYDKKIIFTSTREFNFKSIVRKVDLERYMSYILKGNVTADNLSRLGIFEKMDMFGMFSEKTAFELYRGSFSIRDESNQTHNFTCTFSQYGKYKKDFSEFGDVAILYKPDTAFVEVSTYPITSYLKLQECRSETLNFDTPIIGAEDFKAYNNLFSQDKTWCSSDELRPSKCY